MRGSAPLLLLLLAFPVSAELLPEVRVAADPAQRYALFSPEGVPATEPRPLLMVLDPRGRALEALELFRPAAERLGWRVASSYETRSDGAAGPNGERNHRAIPALLDDVQRRLPVAPRRLYLAGMSGTARVAWAYALGLGDHAAGVFAAAGGLPVAPRAFPFAYFGSAGDADFNYAEMRTLDQALDGLAPHRFAFFAGGHSWPPPEVAERALDYFELRAMEEGRRAVDPARVQEALARDAEAFARAGARDALELARQVLAVYRTFAAAVDLGPWQAHVARLERDPAVGKILEAEKKALALEAGFTQTLARWRAEFEAAELPPPHAQSLNRLRVAALHREAGDRDRARAASARRRLASAAAFVTGELPAALLARGDWRRVAAAYALGVEILPQDGWTHAQLARAHARLGQWRQAHAAMAKAKSLGFDPGAAPNDGDPLWQKLAAGE